MAQVVLSGVGQAVGGGVGRAIGATLGQMVDRRLISSLGPAQQRGPRLETLRVQSSADGAPMACVFGRARVTGQVIWAARFLEKRNSHGGGKGGPRSVDYDYSLSFAVALCEGPIDGVGRVWADGQALDLSGMTMRVHRGAEDQTPDPLIEAVEGEASAYRGTAYVVFEDLPLGPFGNRTPQLSFEVFRRAGQGGLEDQLEGVCLIPGAGEFVLASEVVRRRDGLTRTTAENQHHGEGRPDLLVSLDQLEAQCPNLKRVSLVIGWFGDDLRAGHCVVKPGVERRDKLTEPQVWSVAGLDRAGAHLVSQIEGAPAYGGTPSDESVRQAVAALKAKGWAVTLYPFVFMDIAADNTLPDPYGATRQAAYPWRGRIVGDDGASASAQVAALFGAANGWGLRRIALHYAALAAQTGADGLLIGSEMRGVTRTRDAAGGYPAVAAYRALAAECRAVAGSDVALSYAADWSEYFGHHPDDGSADVVFHLDPLWADANIDHVGIDWYPPLGDWREGDGGVDAQTFKGPADRGYLAAQVAGGEGFDWFYASDADRDDQVRTPIVDTAHGEDWVFRPKDLIGWWSHAHHDRIGGVRAAVSTAWAPGMKPIRLTEFGCPAVDRGCNAPNLFLDPKSAESALPPASTGSRDDGLQRRVLEAVLGHFEVAANNPVSAVYGGRMLEGADAWCWDARPFPAFPALDEVWADAGAWRRGHWLNGRLGGDAPGLIGDILKRGGLADEGFVVEEPDGAVSGYVIDRPMRTRDALEPLISAFDMTVGERGAGLAILRGDGAAVELDPDKLALGEEGAAEDRVRATENRPGTSRVRFIDEAADYQTGSVVVRSDGQGGAADVDLPIVCPSGLAERLAMRLLADGAEESLTVGLGPLDALRLEAGDRIEILGRAGTWRVDRISLDETPTADLVPVIEAAVVDHETDWSPGDAPTSVGTPLLRVLDLPPLAGVEEDGRPVVVVAGDPWRPMQVFAGGDANALTIRASVDAPATVGTLVEALSPGMRGRWDRINELVVKVEGSAPASLSDGAVLSGANAMAVETERGWEILQFATATLVGGDLWRLSGLMRAQQGTDIEMEAGAPEGALVVFLNDSVVRAASGEAEIGTPILWRAAPLGAPPGGVGVAEITGTRQGVRDRPWRPARLRAVAEAGGLRLSWMARSRLHGDNWDREAASDPPRYRVRVLNGGVVLRTLTVESESVLYPLGQISADFPSGFAAGAKVSVAQIGDLFGEGVSASLSLAA